jgi:K+-transporting ATPase ATPase A chain
MIPLLGTYLANIFEGKRTWIHPLLGWMETLSYRLAGIDATREMRWGYYAKTLVLFNFIGLIFLFSLMLIQGYLPLNPQEMGTLSLPLAFNTAVSFVTNTNWQAYSGESTLSYLSQMLGLTVQNFLSAATGICVLMALIRGIVRRDAETIGNFWVDLVRSVVYLLLPLSFIFAIVLVGQGVIQTLSPYVEAVTLEGAKQLIPLGPVASQEAIKQLGSNGGGFFGVNSAHPFENPTGISNFLEMFAILIIPASLVYCYGVMTNSKYHGWLLLLVMFVFSVGGVALSYYAEKLPNPVMEAYPLMEGKETRLRVLSSISWSMFTTQTSNGSVNAMLSSLSPLAGGVALFNIMLGEIIFGGVGVGLCGMLMFVLLTVFLCGLLVGRTPEYMGKKIEKRDIQWVMVAILTPGILILMGAGFAIASQPVFSAGPHGLTETLYAYASAAGNNGSAFSGLNANTDYYNITLGITMLLGRMAIVIPTLAIAGNLVKKRKATVTAGTLSTDTFLFALLLTSVILIVGALTFFPALSLGPIVEQLLMREGRAF